MQFVPSASWYVPHWTFVRIEFVKSIEHNLCCHSDSETDDLSWLFALLLVNYVNVGKLLALNLRSLTVEWKIIIAPIL